ncbi:hypothetical protein AAZX31_02G154400 [Glycine max]
MYLHGHIILLWRRLLLFPSYQPHWVGGCIYTINSHSTSALQSAFRKKDPKVAVLKFLDRQETLFFYWMGIISHFFSSSPPFNPNILSLYYCIFF